MRKKIAVFICAISFSSQRRILDGILEESKKSNIDVFVFTCHINHSVSYMKINGAFAVMTLPDFSNFDGAILMRNTIRQAEIANELVDKIKQSGIPAVSIEEDIEGLHYVGISNYDAQKKIVDHIIEEHKPRNVCYVTGVLDSNEGQERFKAYKDSLKEHGISFDEDLVYKGNYIGESGRLAVKKFLEDGRKIDAVICANDGMALGAIDELKESGYDVPKDVLVAGFDNDSLSRYSVPMLTTIDQNQEELGRTAVYFLKESSSYGLQKRTIDSKLILGESCGCVSGVDYSIEEIRQIYSKEKGTIIQAVDAMKNMSLELAEVTTMEELYEKLPKYVEKSDMDAFFLCVEENDSLSIPLAYCGGKFTSVPKYEKGLVLPDEIRNTKEPQYYVVTSLFFSDTNFGYIIQRGSDFSLESDLAYSWVINIGIAIENIRKIKIMQDMLDRLNKMWMYDTLTNLYNRGGFFHVTADLLDGIKKQNGKCCLMFFDLDGLKKVNDSLGHEAGDKYIVAMAEALKNTIYELEETKKGQAFAAMRYGGDEFVLLCQCDDENDAFEIEKKINREIEKINKNNEQFSLAYSMGLSVLKASEIDNLNELIEEADKKMYRSKKEKRNKGV